MIDPKLQPPCKDLSRITMEEARRCQGLPISNWGGRGRLQPACREQREFAGASKYQGRILAQAGRRVALVGDGGKLRWELNMPEIARKKS